MWRVVISGSHQRLWQLSLVAAAGPQCLPLACSQCSSMNSRSEKTCNLTPSSPLTHLIFNPRLTLSLTISHITSGPQLWSLINTFAQLSNGTDARLTLRVLLTFIFSLTFSIIFCIIIHHLFCLIILWVCLTISVVQLGLVCGIGTATLLRVCFWDGSPWARVYGFFGCGGRAILNSFTPQFLSGTHKTSHTGVWTQGGKDKYKLSHVKYKWNIRFYNRSTNESEYMCQFKRLFPANKNIFLIMFC